MSWFAPPLIRHLEYKVSCSRTKKVIPITVVTCYFSKTALNRNKFEIQLIKKTFNLYVISIAWFAFTVGVVFSLHNSVVRLKLWDLVPKWSSCDVTKWLERATLTTRGLWYLGAELSRDMSGNLTNRYRKTCRRPRVSSCSITKKIIGETYWLSQEEKFFVKCPIPISVYFSQSYAGHYSTCYKYCY